MSAVTGLVDGFRARSGEKTFLDRLDDLRGRLISSAVVVVATTLVGFYMAARPVRFEVPRGTVEIAGLGPFGIGGWTVDLDILSLMVDPVRPYLGGERLKYLSPTDPFFITLKLALCIGLLLALPYLVYQVWALVAPLLRPQERRLAGPSIVASVVLFVAGALLCYHAVIPLMLRFMLGFQTGSLEEFLMVGDYLKLVLRMLVAFGLAFELPIVILVATALGLVSPEFLASKRRHAVAIATVLTAIITPPDVASMVLMLVPVVLLYELGIVLSRAVIARRGTADADVAT